MAFSAEALQRHLHTTRLGRACRALPEATSTVDLAWEWLRQGAPEGAVVVADRQTQGRGRRGRAWASPEGGLWMSVVSRPGLPAGAAGRLGAAMALAAAEAVAGLTGDEVRVKWPNDVVVKARKCGGVLVETRVDGSLIAAAVLSLGLNANLAVAALPETVRETATTLLEATGCRWSLEQVAAEVLDRLEGLWGSALETGETLPARWARRDALAGLEVSVWAAQGEIQGRACGIDTEGALVLMVGRDRVRVSAGEVSVLKAGGHADPTLQAG